MKNNTQKWYKEAFGLLYPLLYPRRNESSAGNEIGQLIEVLQLTGKERILDVCCGTGRHLKALRTRGFDAWGIDLSEPLLAQVASHPSLASRIVRADIRNLPFKKQFHVVLNLFTSFGYFMDYDSNRAAFKQMVSVLKPHGVLIIDHINRPYLERTLINESCDQYGDLEVLQRRRIEGDRVIKDITVHPPNGSTIHITENVKLFSAEEFKDMFLSEGLGDMKLFGSFLSDPLTEDSERMIAVAYKKI